MHNYQIKKIWQDIKKQIIEDHSVVVLNGLVLLLFLGMAVYVKLAGTYYGSDYYSRVKLIERLFAEPFRNDQPYLGLFTHFSGILWCIALTICLFSFTLLKRIRHSHKGDPFILFSAIVLAIFLLDDVFRITLTLDLLVGIPKVVMYSLYGLGLITYIIVFWRRISSTPYILLLAGFGLFVISGMADLAHIRGKGTPVLLEDGTKLLGLVNIILYFWHVCEKEVMRSRNQSN
ncbi:MAG: hypothetical protein AB1861_10975 [Cyanobacteriota bacterium]